MSETPNGDGLGVYFTRLPISLPCAIPVVPATGEAMRNGEPIAIEERTEYCAVDAFWMMGAAPCCDIHMKDVCGVIDVSYDGLITEAAANPAYERDADEILAAWREDEKVPWAERRRYPQDSVVTTTTQGGQQ